jgi:alkylation response protein AidB-like acyl-CoA dehydrogenase
VSEESGGIGLGRLEAALIMEAMAYGCPATSAYISIHNMAAWMIDCFGSPELKHRFPARTGQHGQDRQLLPDRAGFRLRRGGAQTTARLDGDHYVLNGTKQFISGRGL